MDSGTKPFIRNATGLVREISIFDAVAGNLTYASVLSYGILTYTTAPYVFPGSNPIAATLIATFFSIFIALVYTLFSWAMPRSGGDYVWVGRTAHPLLGFVTNFNLTAWFMLFNGFNANWIVTLGLSPSLLVAGSVTSNHALVSLANTLSQPLNIMIVGVVTTAIMVLILVRGVRATFLVIDGLVILSILGTLAMLFVLATSTHADFVNAFNRYGNYSAIIQAAHSAGYSPVGPSALIATLGVMVFVYGSTGYTVVTGYVAGEVKSVRKNAFYSQVLTSAGVGITLAIVGSLILNVVGYDFIGSVSQVYFSSGSQYPFSVPPYPNLFSSMLTTNPILIALIGIGFVASITMPIPMVYMVGTRNMFAWAFDRVVPSKFAEVSPKTHTPIYAILVAAVVQLIGLTAYTYGPPAFIAMVSGSTLAEALSFIVVLVVAIFFPLKRKFYDNSPAKRSVGGIPLISLAGAIGLVFLLMIEYFLFTNPLYGASIPIVYIATAITVGLPIVIFAVSYIYHKDKGITITQSFKEIPPE